MITTEEVEYLEVTINDCSQRFFIGGTVTFDTKPHVGSTQYLISAFNAPDAIITIGGGHTTEIPITTDDLWVMEIPEEVREESGSTHRVAPFRIVDENGYNDEVLYWSYLDAYTDARLWAEDNEADCQVQNAYHNDIEYVEYEEPEEEEEDDEEESDEE